MFGLRSQKKSEKPNSGAEDGSQGQKVYLARGLCLTLSSVKKKKEKLNTKERVESWEAKMRKHLTNSCNTDQGKKNQTRDPWALKETGRLCKGLKGGKSGQAWRHRM